MSYWVCDIVYADFNPRLPRGRRLFLPDPNRINIRFQPTPPSREATEMPAKHLEDFLFQPTPPSREATETVHGAYTMQNDFNPRLPRGRRRRLRILCRTGFQFQPTPPSREATRVPSKRSSSGSPNFNPRLPRGRRLIRRIKTRYTITDFNPRLPRGRRQQQVLQAHSRQNFNPRLPRGRRRHMDRLFNDLYIISTHASLAGGDYTAAWPEEEDPKISTHASLAGGDRKRVYD